MQNHCFLDPRTSFETGSKTCKVVIYQTTQSTDTVPGLHLKLVQKQNQRFLDTQSTDTVPGLHLKPVQKTVISHISMNFAQTTTEPQRGHPSAAA